MADGFTLPYCCLYAIIFRGISCKEEILMIRKVHISSEAMSGGFPRFASSLESSSIAFRPAGVAPQLSPRKFAIKFREICSTAG